MFDEQTAHGAIDVAARRGPHILRPGSAARTQWPDAVARRSGPTQWPDAVARRSGATQWPDAAIRRSGLAQRSDAVAEEQQPGGRQRRRFGCRLARPEGQGNHQQHERGFPPERRFVRDAAFSPAIE